MRKDKNIAGSEQWNVFWGKGNIEKYERESWSKKRIKDILDGYISRGKKVLDAGCGSGFFSKYFCDKGAITYSLDYSAEALEICAMITENRSTLLNNDLLNEDVSTKTRERFDIIFSDGLFEHFLVEDQDRIMGNFKRLLSADGVIVTFVPNRFSPWELIRPFYMPGIKEVPFVLKGLVGLNVRNGMDVIKKGGINTFPFPFSPDKVMGRIFGMLLFTVSKKKDYI